MRRAAILRPGQSLYSLILGRTVPLQAGVIVLGLALPPLAVVPLTLQKRMIDEAIPAADLTLLTRLVAIWIAVIVLTAAIKFGVVWLRGLIAEIVARVLRVALVDAQRRRPPHEGRFQLGTATSIMAAEVEPLGGFAAEALNTPLIQGGTLVGVIGFMFVAEPRLALIGLTALALEATLTPFVQRRINRLTELRIAALRRAGADLILAAEPMGRPVFVRGLRRIRQTYALRLGMNRLKAALKALRNLIDHGAEIAVLGFGALMVMQDETGIGTVVAFLSGLRQLRGPWGELLDFYRRQADARVKYKLVRVALSADGGQSAPAALPAAPAA